MMARSTRLLLAALAVGTALGASPARADENTGIYDKSAWPLEAVDRPLTLASGMLEIRGDTLGINLSKDAVGKPLFIAPDLMYGVNDRFTLGVTHQVGFCLGGAEKNCAKAYNDIGVEAEYALMRAGTMQAMAHGAVLVSSFTDETIAGLDAGLLLRLRAGKVAIRIDPSIYVGVIGRDELSPTLFLGALGPNEVIHMPVDIQYQINTQTMAYVSTGILGPLDGFGDAYAIPFGLGALFAINNRIDFGAEFRFPNAFGKGENKFDSRFMFARLALRL